IPFLAGFLSGYRVGHHSPAAARTVEQTNDEESSAPVFQAAVRDSVGEQISGQRRNAITRAVAVASPAVVGINVTEVREYQYQDPFSQFFGNDPFFRQYFGNKTYRQEIKGLGSGFLISADGYILTNDHVAGNAKEITVTLTNKGKYTAKLIGTDMVSDISL